MVCNRLCLPMKVHNRLSGGASANFNISPAQDANSDAKRLRGGLLGREAPGQTLRATPAVTQLAVRVDPVQKALAPSLYCTLDSSNLNDVDSARYLHFYSRTVLTPSA